MELSPEDLSFFNAKLQRVAARTSLKTLDAYIQHGDTSTLWHSIAVAYYSLCLSNLLKIRCQREELICGALLHDYYLYDWHVPAPDHRLHGFTHPKRALHNACRDYSLGKAGQNAISRHMFPLTLIPPKYREGLLVCLVDKGCSLSETFRRGTYEGIRKQCAAALEPIPKQAHPPIQEKERKEC